MDSWLRNFVHGPFFFKPDHVLPIKMFSQYYLVDKYRTLYFFLIVNF